MEEVVEKDYEDITITTKTVVAVTKGYYLNI
jgi:hypothetical protein